MHPTAAYQVAQDRIADQQRQAGQDALAQAARRPHATSTPLRPRPAAALTCRMLMLRGARRRAAQAACSPSAPCANCA